MQSPQKAQKQTIIYGITDQSQDPIFTRIDNWLIDHSGVNGKGKGQLFHALQLLVASGVPFTRAIQIVAERQRNQRLQRILNTVAYDMTARGMSFSKAISKYPRVFSAAEVKMLYSAELTGRMEETLTIIAEQIQRNITLRSRIRGAMTYPIVVLCVVIIAIAIIMIKVVPQFSGLFEDIGAELPTATKAIIAMSSFISQYWWALLVAFGLIWAGVKHWLSTVSGQQKWGMMMLNIPLFKDLVRNINTTRIALNLSTLLKADLGVPESLQIVSEVMPNMIISDALKRIKRHTLEGYKLHDSFTHESLLDPILAEVIEIGEQGGKIPEVLQRTGTQYEQEVEEQLKNISTLIEPIMLIIVALVVVFMALAILSPILRFQQLASGGI